MSQIKFIILLATPSRFRAAGQLEKESGMSTEKRKRGEGSIGLRRDSKNYFIGYYRADGVRVKESTHTTNLTEARKILRDRLAAVDRGETPDSGRVKVADLYADLKQHVKANAKGRGVRSLDELEWRWAHLKPVFGHVKATAVATKAVTAYTVRRQAECKECGGKGDCEDKGKGECKYTADATINRELATLRRMFNFGKQSNRVRVAPWIPLLRENNTRQGFVEDAEFRKLAAEASGFLRVFLSLGYTYGWRKSELLGLRVRQVNLSTRTIRLETGTTKNGEGREVAMTQEVEALLRAAIAGKTKDDYVLTWDDGRRVKDFRGMWEKITAAAGCPDLLVHDLRRSGVKALRRAGVPESVVMAVSGLLTPAIFRRYAIVSSADQREAVTLLEAARERNSPVSVPFSEDGSNHAGAKVN